jgi:Zn-dependent protease
MQRGVSVIRIPTPIPIHIHPFFWLVCILIGTLYSGFNVVGILVWTVVIFISVLFHELGHALTARAFGKKATITLMGFGGVTQHTGKDLSALRQFLIIFNGPLFGFILFALFYYIKGTLVVQTGTFFYFVHAMWIINLIWTVINLFPILPMDGGQLVRVVLEHFFKVNGLKAAILISLSFSIGIATLSFFYGQWILAILFFFFAMQNMAFFRQVKPLRSQDADKGQIEKLRLAQKKSQEQDLEGAKHTLEEIRDQNKEGVLFLQATEMLVSILKKEGDLKHAYELLHSIGSKLSFHGKVMLQELAYCQQKYEEALQIGTECFELFPNAEVAFKNSCASAQLHKSQEVIGWLKSSIEYGLEDPKQAVVRKDFDPVRNDIHFQEFLRNI